MAEKSAANLVEGVAASRKVPFERVLFALGIRYVGETVAKKLARAYKNIDALMAASADELQQVDEIGQRIAGSVVEFFSDPVNRERVEKLKGHGLQFSLSEEQLRGQTDLFRGKTFVVSGVFESIGRNELKKRIEDNGGKVTSSVSARTNFLVAGANMGPSKREKADKNGVPIISETQFLEMLGD